MSNELTPPAEADALARLRQENPACSGCGGPHPFDTSVPSVTWNRVVRAQGLPEYLCTTCIVKAFAAAGVSFMAELYGDEFHGLPLEIRVNGQEAQAAAEIQEENNLLRHTLAETEAARARVTTENESLKRKLEVDDLAFACRTARVTDAEERLAAAERRAAQAEELFLKYGQHAPSCRVGACRRCGCGRDQSGHDNQRLMGYGACESYEPTGCTCGFAEALAAVRPHGEEM